MKAGLSDLEEISVTTANNSRRGWVIGFRFLRMSVNYAGVVIFHVAGALPVTFGMVIMGKK